MVNEPQQAGHVDLAVLLERRHEDGCHSSESVLHLYRLHDENLNPVGAPLVGSVVSHGKKQTVPYRRS